jgi:hypothetical protein
LKRLTILWIIYQRDKEKLDMDGLTKMRMLNKLLLFIAPRMNISRYFGVHCHFTSGVMAAFATASLVKLEFSILH